MTANHYILGLCCYSHESTVSLINNGKILYVFEEERLNREKHTWKFPLNALKLCLERANIGIDDIETVTFFFKPQKEILGNMFHVLRYFPKSLNLILGGSSGGAELGALQRIHLCSAIGEKLTQSLGAKKKVKVEFIEHHLAHAASCFYVSEFQKASILTIDGRGESTTTLLAKGDGIELDKLQEIPVPHSLGHLYAAVTDFLGFKPFFDEWKVMGMSAYGTPVLLNDFRKLVRLSQKDLFRLDLNYFSYHTHGSSRWVSDNFIKNFGPKRAANTEINQRHFDLAFALQRVVEETGVFLAKELYKKNPGVKNLCMAGGVALNILMNRKILEETEFENVFIQPLANDAGTSFGSSLYHWHHTLKKQREYVFSSPYLGPEYSEQEILEALNQRSLPYKKCENIAAESAQIVANGQILGWYQGAVESGPRALGNRSIIADPRDPKMKERLNLRVKRREFFRPFAPSILEEHTSEYFDLPKGIQSPYMVMSALVKDSKREVIPAVTHADGTARPHTVSKIVNPRYWNLINEFKKITGVPVVINTSFNENEPIVCTPLEAIDCFMRTDFDALALGDYLVLKKDIG